MGHRPLVALAGALAVVALLSAERGSSSSAPAPAPAASTPSAPGALGALGDVEPSWSVDLAEVQALLPDNAYWALGAPTDDPALLAVREAAASERNARYGAVLSGNATWLEIDAYYDERTRISEDYVELAEVVLERYGAQLSERDAGLFELARDMHRRRLAQLPAERARAFDRRDRQDEARAAWNDVPTEQGGP